MRCKNIRVCACFSRVSATGIQIVHARRRTLELQLPLYLENQAPDRKVVKSLSDFLYRGDFACRGLPRNLGAACIMLERDISERVLLELIQLEARVTRKLRCFF